MKLIVTSSDRRSAQEDLSKKRAATLALLDEKYPADKRPIVRTLADMLASQTPIYYLARPEASEQADWVSALFDFLNGRNEDVAVALLPLGGRDGSLLVTNCADAPYLVHTIQMCLNRRHIHFRVVTHPIFNVEREQEGVTAIHSTSGPGKTESMIVIELDKSPAENMAGLEDEIAQVMRDVLGIRDDSAAIVERLKMLAECDQCSSFADFFKWFGEDNSALFAYRCLRISPEKDGDRLVVPEEGLSLGLYEKLFLNYKSKVRPISEFNPRFQQLLLRREQIGIEVLERVSPILRAEQLVYLGARQELEDGTWLEHGFIGLPSESALSDQTLSVPVLRQKIEAALNSLGVPKGSHDYRKIIEILNTYPKIELFFMDQAEIVETVRTFALLYRHGMVRVIPTKGLAIRGVTLLLIMPKDFYSDDNLARIESFLCRHFRVEQVFTRIIHLSPDYMSLHVNLQPDRDEVVVDIDKIERGLTHITQPWSQKLHQLLEKTLGDSEGSQLWEKYRHSFAIDYRALIHPRFAVRDIKNIERLLGGENDVIDLWGPFSGKEQYYRLQFYSCRETYLNELMPFLENLYLTVIDETDFTVQIDATTVYIKSFSIRNRVDHALPLSEVRENMLETLMALRTGQVENDYLHHLLVLTGLDWRQVDVFRGYRNYYFQLGSPFTKKRVAFAFINNPEVTAQLYRYFAARFEPRPEWASMSEREEQGLMPIRMALSAALEAVSDINEDQILRAFFNLIDSTIRTNFFIRRDSAEYFFSFKISAIGIIEMPAPRPMYEVYVHSALMEGIHLRGGKVARGGIRWSDRPDDFRTEVLGLMKTQMTKNTLIVPVGSKGGFVVKTPFTTREEGAELSKEAYKTLMRGLLDLTDNRIHDEIVTPDQLVAYDDVDPYLVVAADKGTAHLPDTANSVSAEYDFWLDDAFASGGSAGYDHKKLAITARGAWVSVQRHFREIGINVQTDPVTVIGIGDMGGDVFGNGMLQSRSIKLIAAFNHMHIFIDPDPDPEKTWHERKRLFDLPRSSWADYDQSLISAGGGVFERAAKDIPLSDQIREWLGIRHASLDGQTLIRYILAAKADLLWNGGIGTYVKSSTENNENAGDRANDPVRIDSSQLRVKVVGEGGNLGMTQLARIEYALAGGRINTDAIDNSGGVDCSDHEVNLKILMGQLAKNGKVESRQERDKILLSVTDEVCDDVLANNYSQSLALSLDLVRSEDDIEPFITLLDRLSRAGILDRRSEYLPSAREINTRTDSRLVKPELAILLAYSKMHLYQSLLEGELASADVVQGFLLDYFPNAIQQDFREDLLHHPLAPEIVATVLTNYIVDQAGCCFVMSQSERTGRTPEVVAAVYLLLDLAIESSEMRSAVFALDNRMSAGKQHQLLLRLENTLDFLTEGSLSATVIPELKTEVIRGVRSDLDQFTATLSSVLDSGTCEAMDEEVGQLVGLGMEEAMARRFVKLDVLKDFLPVMKLVELTGKDLFSVFTTYRDLRASLEFDRLFNLLSGIHLPGRWDKQARHALERQFESIFFRLAQEICVGNDCNCNTFLSRHRSTARKWQTLCHELQASPPVNLNPFNVLVELLESMTT